MHEGACMLGCADDACAVQQAVEAFLKTSKSLPVNVKASQSSCKREQHVFALQTCLSLSQHMFSSADIIIKSQSEQAAENARLYASML